MVLFKGRSLQLRNTVLDDIPSLWRLVETFRHVQDDHLQFTLEDLVHLIDGGFVYTIDWYGLPVGFFSFTEVFPDLHASIHNLIEPKYIRRALNKGIYERMFALAFEKWKLKKLKVNKIPVINTSTGKLAKKLGFRQCGYHHSELAFSGKAVDARDYELTFDYWSKQV